MYLLCKTVFIANISSSLTYTIKTKLKGQKKTINRLTEKEEVRKVAELKSKCRLTLD